ncbi:nickel-dependent hydrogenase large subunit [Paraburkholderia silvatlantica]|uniref:Nickel-dependent hydrogenase n=1 Tax=Paraburkholderia silvatlantica TaxID=321895 RepID=A0A2V4TK23_9BURK|nr:nickel-dependent hydrogenase large subunit [Paraburkholderia silvatlantica]PYE21598.1 nickel-dependent hydrogenase [Paraburkholderia silvatlantica]TDQ86721.1 nickel-dependent hydrogenase [Paraburkholderia silvatlantica]
MSAATLAALAGQYRVRPGRQDSIAGGRPPLAAALLRGQAAATAASRLAALFALCGLAHRLCAELAVGAAGASGEHEREDTANAAHAMLLTRETLAVHLRCIWTDWPARLAAAAPHRLPDVEAAGAPGWVERHVLGMPARAWLAHWADDPRGCLSAWSARAATFPARLLADCRAYADTMRATPRPLVIDEARLSELAGAIAGSAAFAHAPLQHGLPAESGVWTRSDDPRALDYDTPWLRLGARVADVARLAAGDGSAGALRFGARTCAPGEALGWCEMARGVLVHWVRLAPDDAARIEDYRVVAPTEWNFHRQGTLAQALSRLDRTPDDRALAARTGVWMGAFDPCIAYAVDTGSA